jgi:WD40 repeat protein
MLAEDPKERPWNGDKAAELLKKELEGKKAWQAEEAARQTAEKQAGQETDRPMVEPTVMGEEEGRALKSEDVQPQVKLDEAKERPGEGKIGKPPVKPLRSQVRAERETGKPAGGFGRTNSPPDNSTRRKNTWLPWVIGVSSIIVSVAGLFAIAVLVKPILMSKSTPTSPINTPRPITTNHLLPTDIQPNKYTPMPTTTRGLIFKLIRSDLIATDQIDYLGFIDVAFSPDGEYFASASENGVISLWNLSGEIVDQIAYNYQSSDWTHRDEFNSIAFSPNGDYLAVGSYFGYIGLFKIENSSLVNLAWLKDGMHYVTDVVFTIDGVLINASDDGHIRLWNFLDERLIGKIDMTNDQIDLSRDGNILGVGAGVSLSIVQVMDHSIRCSYHIPVNDEINDYVTDVSISNDGVLMAVVTSHGGIYILNTSDCSCLLIGSDSNDTNNSYAEFFGDHYLITGGGGLNMWQIDNTSLLWVDSFSYGEDFAVSPDNNSIVIVDGDGKVTLSVLSSAH